MSTTREESCCDIERHDQGDAGQGKTPHSGLPQLVSQLGPRSRLLLPRLGGVKKTPQGRTVLAAHEQWLARRGEERKVREQKKAGVLLTFEDAVVNLCCH